MIRVILTESEPGIAHGLRALLTAADQIEIIGLAQDGLEAAQMATLMRPDVLLVHEDLPAADGYEVCRLVSLAAPEVGCILLIRENHPLIAEKAMLAGANALLPLDTDAKKLWEAVNTCAFSQSVLANPAYAAVTDPTRMPVTVGLISAKDGVGKTTLAVNLSVLFASRFPDSAVLVDMYAQLGDVSLVLNVPPQGSLVDLAAYANELDIELVETHLSTHHSGLKVLSGSTTPKPVGLEVLSVPYVASLLGILRRHYRFCFCDLPPTVWNGSLYVLSRCQTILVITNLFELTTIRDTNSLLRIIIDGGYASAGSVKLVVNRASPKDRFTVADLEEATGMKVDFLLPNDTENVITAANRGEPFVLDRPRAPLTRGLGEVADYIINSVPQPAQKKAA